MVTPTGSIRKNLYNLWAYNPYLTPKKACEQLQLDYKHHGNYVKKLLSEFRSYYSFGSPQEALRCPHRRVFVWERVVGDRVEALKGGWVEVANKNGMFVFRHDLGSVHWYRNGLVRLYLRGSVQLARAKELFCKAFSWFSNEEFKKYLDVPLREESKHWVFDLGAPVPRFDIRKFERSHGLRIYNDKSHTTSIEVEETSPFWIDEWRKTNQEFGRVIGQFGVEIKEHLKLIQEWQKEAVTRIGVYAPRRKQRIKTTQPPIQRNLLGWMLGGEAKT